MRLTVTLSILFLFHIEAIAKRTVCTATINSSDEKEVFKEKLDPKKFDFVELTTVGKPNQSEGTEEWFNRACDAGIQCDVLLISGHFGGVFFGKNETDATLSAATLERKSCERSCEGILKTPKEVFLFGCNTLAKKDQDHRTPDAYRRVLINDGIDPQTAERVVQARYGALGSSFHDQMRRVFHDVPVIHGFDSVGPSGKTVRPFLNRFFSSSEPFDQRLGRIESERLVDLIANSNSKLNEINAILSKTFSKTAYSFCSGLRSEDPQFHHKEKICQLFDLNKTNAEREQIARQMLLSSDRLMFMPMIGEYFSKNTLSEDFKKELLRDPNIKDLLAQDNEALISSPLTYVEILALRQKVGFISEEEYKSGVLKIVKNIINPLTRDSIDTFCSLRSSLMEPIAISWSDIPVSQRTSRYLPGFVGCIDNPDIETKRGAFNASLQLPTLERLGAFLHLSDTKSLRTEIYQQLIKISKLTDPAYDRYRQALISKTHPNDAIALQSIEQLANKGSIFFAIDALEARGLNSPNLSRSSLRKLMDKNLTASEVIDNFHLYITAGGSNSKDIQGIFKQHENQSSTFMHQLIDGHRKGRLDREVITDVLTVTQMPFPHLQTLAAYQNSKPLKDSDQKRLFSALKRGINVDLNRSILMSQDTSPFTAEEKSLLKGLYYKCTFKPREMACKSFINDGN